jgi:hypothetical protein
LQVWVGIPRLVGHIDKISLISLRNVIGLAGHIGLINLNGRVGQTSLASQVGLGFSGAIGKYDGYSLHRVPERLVRLQKITAHCKQFTILFVPQKNLAKPHSRISTKYLQSEL